MTEQWQELKETIKEMRDNDGTLTQQKTCKFLADYMETLEKAEAQTCENINEDYADCDQFKCSECQIELQDWNRVERDDDGEVSYHEYTFRYCPHCGRRIKYDE